VVETFSDLVSLSTANEEALKEVDGIGEKRAKLILEGIQQMRNRRNYHLHQKSLLDTFSLNNKRQNSIKNSAFGWVQPGISFEHSDML
jgi:NAD-dependent DNA ligase